MNDIVIGLILGIVEGITEFLPVSSTGHLILTGYFLNFTDDRAKIFEVFIQLGAILSVVVLYWRRFLSLIPGSSFTLSAPSTDGSGVPTVSTFQGFKGAFSLVVACLPVFFLGALFRSQIKSLFDPLIVALSLIVGGCVMVLVERFFPRPTVKTLDRITLKHALTVGLFQCFALWPGMSRSASTIIGGLFAGLDRKTAAEFSFFVGVPVMCAAVGLDLLKEASYLHASDIPLFATGFVVAFVVAAVAIKSFIALMSRVSLAPYGVYRIIVGLLTWYILGSGAEQLP
jgi:undecaprenyl-diphosphatase